MMQGPKDRCTYIGKSRKQWRLKTDTGGDHSHQLGGLGSAMSSPSGVQDRAPTAQRVSSILSNQDGLSCHYNVSYLWIMKTCSSVCFSGTGHFGMHNVWLL